MVFICYRNSHSLKLFCFACSTNFSFEQEEHFSLGAFCIAFVTSDLWTNCVLCYVCAWNSIMPDVSFCFIKKINFKQGSKSWLCYRSCVPKLETFSQLNTLAIPVSLWLILQNILFMKTIFSFQKQRINLCVIGFKSQWRVRYAGYVCVCSGWRLVAGSNIMKKNSR